MAERRHEQEETDNVKDAPPTTTQGPPLPETTPGLPPLGSEKWPPGARLSAVTFHDGERWEWGKDGKLTKFKPQ